MTGFCAEDWEEERHQTHSHCEVMFTEQISRSIDDSKLLEFTFTVTLIMNFHVKFYAT